MNFGTPWNAVTFVVDGESYDPHNKIRIRLYSVWRCMRYRCYTQTDRNFPGYGGRGIRVCNEWRYSFLKFLEWSLHNGYRKGLMLDRINNDKGYSPKNCRYTTYKVSNSNKRSNTFIEWRGERKTLMQWSEETGIPESTIRTRMYGDKRLKKWESLDEILSTPPMKPWSRAKA
jgi:hypothetical protein